MLLSKHIIWLVIYSFLGWAYETILCSIEEKHFVKRGFLYGPYCPVYGFGALLDILVIGQIQNPIALFFAGMVVTCILEYFTSWLLEVLFHARWWDYSYMKFHIKGRICLAGALVFGLFSVLLIKFIHPFVVSLLNQFSYTFLTYTALFLAVILLTDFLFTIITLSKFNNTLKELQNYITEKLSNSNIKSQIDKHSTYNLIKDKNKYFISKLTNHNKRLLHSFPRFNSTLYNDAIKKIREYLKNYKNNQ